MEINNEVLNALAHAVAQEAVGRIARHFDVIRAMGGTEVDIMAFGAGWAGECAVQLVGLYAMQLRHSDPESLEKLEETMRSSIGDVFDSYREHLPQIVQTAIQMREAEVMDTMVKEAAELLRCSPEEALWGIEAACVTRDEWADDVAREGALARMRGAFEELDSGQAEGPERGVDAPFDADEHGQPITDVPETSPSVQPRAHARDGDTNHPRTDGRTNGSTSGDRFSTTSDGMTCRHENTTEGVDDEGNLIEPAHDVCLDCGERID